MDDSEFDALQADVAGAINALMQGEQSEGEQMLINCYGYDEQYIINAYSWTPMLINFANPLIWEDGSIYQDQQFFRVSIPGLYRVYGHHRFSVPSQTGEQRLIVRILKNGLPLINRSDVEVHTAIGITSFPLLRTYDDIYLDGGDEIRFHMYCSIGGAVVSHMAVSWYKVYRVKNA
jgi:hypothetical protein